MSTPPIRIPITADDQYSATLSTAQAKVREFGGISGAAGDRMAHSFHEAKGAAALLGEEVGVKLNRHLRSILASSELIGPILASSFSIVAAVGFIEVLAQIPEAIKKATDELAGFGAESKKQYDDAVKQNEFLLRHFKTIGEGYLLLGQLRKQSAGASATRDAFSNPLFGIGEAFGAGGAAGALTQLVTNMKVFNSSVEDGAKAEERMQGVMERINELQVEHNKEIDKTAKTARQQLLEALKEENAEATKFWQTWLKLNDEIDKGVRELQGTAFSDIGKRAAGQRKELAPWLDPKILPPGGSPLRTDQAELLKLQNDLNESWSKARQILDEIETPAQHYVTTIAELKELLRQGRINQEQFNAAVGQAKLKFDPLTRASVEFGKAMGDALKQGILMGRSWNDIFKSLLVTIVELIVRFTLLKSLEDKFGKGGSSGGWGGLLTSIVGGFSGAHAAGGYMAPGTWGIAGENGPEPIFAGATGMTILPNRSMGGGGTTVYDFRGAVVTDDLVRRAEAQAMVSVMGQRAVGQAVAIVRENGLRGRG